MLTAETKRRINSARDILVGQLPLPTDQVELITIALIYKFMDDIDEEARSIGGKASFFTGDLRDLSWRHIISNTLSADARVIKLTQGIEAISDPKNTQIPELFKSIFRNAFLKFRDGRTLKLFLDEINGFTYDHSEELGNAFEYILESMGVQADNGQFRTPRNIIEFIVDVVDPQKDETILDPACGTAGFLISAYKHIMAANTSAKAAGKNPHAGDLLKGNQRDKLTRNVVGYDITPLMCRLSRVNMYLHHFSNPVIHEYDTLTNKNRWDDKFDILLANPPFMTPKGGIRPHDRFAISANRSEVLFVDYIAEHLNPAGRAGIIVPEGIIFQSQNAYKELRRMLVDGFLWAVVSLPAGVFNPYSGVKTSILFLDRALAKQNDEVLFVKVENDGFGLGAQRREIELNDLPEALKIIQTWKRDHKVADGKLAHAVSRKRILESPDISLSGDRYRAVAVRNGKWPMVKLGEIIKAKPQYGSGASKVQFDGKVRYVRITDIDDEGNLKNDGIVSPSKFESDCVLHHGDLLLARSGSIGRAYVHEKTDGCYQFAGYLIRFPIDTSKALPRFVFHLTHSQTYWNWIETMRKAGTLSNINATEFSSLEIPLPPVAEQERLVAELESYRRVIESARQILAQYKPTLRLNPAWPNKDLGTIARNLDGKRVPITKGIRKTGKYPYYGASGIVDYVDDFIFDGDYLLLSEDGANLLARSTPIAFSVSGKVWVNNHAHVLEFDEPATRQFAEHYINSIDISGFVTGSAQPKLSQANMNRIPIPFPPLAEQRALVAELETERSLVEANRELAARFEKKLQDALARIWGEPSSGAGK
jgi:type I restriction enzyme M protein